VSADFGGYYGSRFFTSHTQTYLFGPQISLPGRISPFFHALAGVAMNTTNSLEPFVRTTSFSSAIGGGVDLRLNHFASVRLAQFDYLMTRFDGSTQNEFRISTGIVLRF
jgi:hypothetical protein